MLMLSSKHGDDFFSVSLPVVIVAIVMLVFTFSDELPGRLVIIVYDVSALLLLSFGNFQIPAAAVRVVLASLGLHKKNGENSEKNLKASLIIFYGMVLGQGILYIVACLLEVFSFIPRKYLIRHGGLGGQMGVEYVNLYYAYAFEKCMGGAVLAPKKISLITFAMDSLNSDSSRKKLYGVQMLHKFQKKEQLRTKTITKLTNDTRTVVSLFDMLDWTSNGDEEIRLFAAKVTAELAGSLRVVQIPGATQLVASLLDTDHQQTTRDHFLFIDSQIPAAAVRVVLALVGILHLHQKDKANKEGIDKPDNEKNLKASLIIFYGMKCMGGAVLAPKKISLITFAMDSLNSDSSRKKLYGVQMLHKFLKKEQLRTKTITKLTNDTKTVASLFDMLDWTSDGDEEIRLFAAKAMRRAANSFTLLADAALEELPSTMAAVRLSGMEISDLTLELSDLSQEIADGVNKSAKVAQAVETGLGQMRDLAMQQATSMIEERANLQTIPNSAKKSNGSSTRQRRQEKGKDHSTGRMEP
ncbi:hypothetical protein OsI_38152 [Oryza sativa Indica Group]|uniref:Uncharacterized protein n=1 Tax=Oryza sativa subsp. indica TaxID=39946 RepID=B8BPD1_ORYSI|nr:hypothetical protein OsI_38152 [Oryza sativa Indica Group]